MDLLVLLGTLLAPPADFAARRQIVPDPSNRKQLFMGENPAVLFPPRLARRKVWTRGSEGSRDVRGQDAAGLFTVCQENQSL